MYYGGSLLVAVEISSSKKWSLMGWGELYVYCCNMKGGMPTQQLLFFSAGFVSYQSGTAVYVGSLKQFGIVVYVLLYTAAVV